MEARLLANLGIPLSSHKTHLTALPPGDGCATSAACLHSRPHRFPTTVHSAGSHHGDVVHRRQILPIMPFGCAGTVTSAAVFVDPGPDHNGLSVLCRRALLSRAATKSPGQFASGSYLGLSPRQQLQLPLQRSPATSLLPPPRCAVLSLLLSPRRCALFPRPLSSWLSTRASRPRLAPRSLTASCN
jgi:hypothetical protein